MSKAAIKVCSLAGDTGFGFSMSSLKRALNLGAGVIAAQGTSADPGPDYLGAGKTFYPLVGVRRDLATLLPHSRAARVPVVMSVGGAGARASVEPVVDAVREIALEMGGQLRVAVIYADIDKKWLAEQIDSELEIPRLGDWPSLSPKLTRGDVARSTNIVAQMGPEPIMSALDAGSTLCLPGVLSTRPCLPRCRCCTDSIRAFRFTWARPLNAGRWRQSRGPARTAFLASSKMVLSPWSRCRRNAAVRFHSIAAHSFYERSDPEFDDLPGGQLDTSKVKYEQLDPRTVRVSGSRWHPSDRYTVKLEGAAIVGQRAVCMAGVRDPIMIEQMDVLLDDVRNMLAERYDAASLRYTVDFRLYGRDAVMGEREPVQGNLPHELGLLIDVVAPSLELAEDICAFTRSAVNHNEFPGCRTSAGNLALAFSPSELPVGPVYGFNIWHLLPLRDPCALFKAEVITMGEK